MEMTLHQQLADAEALKFLNFACQAVSAGADLSGPEMTQHLRLLLLEVYKRGLMVRSIKGCWK